MNFGIDSIIKTFDKAFNLKKNVVAILHIVTALLTLFVLLKIGGEISGGAAIIFGLIAMVLFYYILMRNYYFLSFFALEELKSNKTPDYSAAKASFNEQKWSAVFAPVLFVLAFVAIFLIEFLLNWIFMQIPVAGSIIQALLMLPLFVFNFFLLMVILFGSGLIFPIMIEQKKGISDTLKAVIITIKKRLQSVLIYYMLSGFLFTFLFLIVLFLTVFALVSSGGLLLQGMFGAMFHKFSVFLPRLDVVTSIILSINIAVILAFLFAYLSNISVGIQSSIYMAVKEGIDYNEKFTIDLNKIKNNLKDSLK